MPDNSDMELLVKQEGAVVHVTLNRPEVLNSLSLEMIRLLSAGLARWEQDDTVKAVFIKGAGDKAFCAGGDVKSTYRTGMAFRRGEIDESIISLFYGEEYILNRRMFHYKKPLFAFMNGITMGGGFGIAGSCRYRIASERTVFAMPETAIGFFPDVGSMYFLNRAPGESGAFLTLTGGKIEPEDMLFCSFATHYVPLAQQKDMEKKLERAVRSDSSNDQEKLIKEILGVFHNPIEKKGALQQNIEVINECLRGDDVQAIMETLRKAGTSWALEQEKTIRSRSPLSLKVSLAHLRQSKTMDFDAVTAQDFILAQRFMRDHDFYEGVRAVLVDKDHKPQWEPKTLDDVSEVMVEDYFRPEGMALDEMAA